MTFRQVIRPGQQDDVRAHEHDASEVSGTFGFFRALKAVIDGDLNISGFIRTALTGNRVEIRPSSSSLNASITLFTGTGDQAGLIEPEPAGGVGYLGLAGPNDGSGAVTVRLVNDGVGQFQTFAGGNFTFLVDATEIVRIVADQLLLVDGTAAAPSVSFLASGQQDVGFYRIGADIIGVSVGGVEVARFTAGGITLATGNTIDSAEADDALGYQLISSTTVTGGNNYDSGTFPTGFRNFRLIAKGERNAAGLSALNVRFNGDTDAEYRRTIMRWNGAGTASTSFNDAGTAYLPGDWGDELGTLELNVIGADGSLVGIQSQLGGREGSATTDQMLAMGKGEYFGGPATSMTVAITDGFTGATFDLYGSR